MQPDCIYPFTLKAHYRQNQITGITKELLQPFLFRLEFNTLFHDWQVKDTSFAEHSPAPARPSSQLTRFSKTCPVKNDSVVNGFKLLQLSDSKPCTTLFLVLLIGKALTTQLHACLGQENGGLQSFAFKLSTWINISCAVKFFNKNRAYTSFPSPRHSTDSAAEEAREQRRLPIILEPAAATLSDGAHALGQPPESQRKPSQSAPTALLQLFCTAGMAASACSWSWGWNSSIGGHRNTSVVQQLSVGNVQGVSQALSTYLQFLLRPWDALLKASVS